MHVRFNAIWILTSHYGGREIHGSGQSGGQRGEQSGGQSGGQSGQSGLSELSGQSLL